MMIKCAAPLIIALVFISTIAYGQPILTAGQPGQLDIRTAGENSLRITLKPLTYKNDFPYSPALSASLQYPALVISIREIETPITRKAGSFTLKITQAPLSIVIVNKKGRIVQRLIFEKDGRLSFNTGDQPILGMGEGGPKSLPGSNWRDQPVQFDRRGLLDSMQPRWQSGAYGSRNPVAMLVGTRGWGLFVVSPWVLVDLKDKDRGYFIPWKPAGGATAPQGEKDQDLNQGKGLPPADSIVDGLIDLFVFDGQEPAALMRDYSRVTGPAAMPPRWALGYMQSHRTLVDEDQMIGIVDTFRNKRIPLDAVIYLGTGFVPVGWNKKQPSFEPNPVVFKRDIADFTNDMHNRHVKVILHIVPWDRDKLPGLHGTIPAKPGEVLDASHIENYWQQHLNLVRKGVDGFWPDEGDWFNLFERIKRHQLYYQGHLSANPDIRPWSLQRNGYPGIAQWDGWVWSGDTESSWKTLEAQVAVGINYSLSIGPYWGSDIGGFYSNKELTGELYARWFQFGAFCGLFRSHGRTWRTRLPWGWGLSYMGPSEDRQPPLQSELNNPNIEPITKKYDELRYQLLPYTYTLAWEARNSGMPLMRAMWLHYPDDENVKGMGTQYLWGRDLLIAPVFEKGATTRQVYLPKGDWYDWWTNTKMNGGQTITRKIDLSIMPIYVRAGAIIPTDPVRQYTAEPVEEPTTLTIYSGADGDFTLYDDDGISQDYLQGKGIWIRMQWNDKARELTLKPGGPAGSANNAVSRKFKVRLLPEGIVKEIDYSGASIMHTFVTHGKRKE
jgi:alpha-glucosidase/alpha-D-xyloside xylohydrolase